MRELTCAERFYMMCVSDLEEPFLPLPAELLVNLEESRYHSCLTQIIHQVVLQKSVSAQIRQLNLYISDSEG